MGCCLLALVGGWLFVANALIVVVVCCWCFPGWVGVLLSSYCLLRFVVGCDWLLLRSGIVRLIVLFFNFCLKLKLDVVVSAWCLAVCVTLVVWFVVFLGVWLVFAYAFGLGFIVLVVVWLVCCAAGVCWLFGGGGWLVAALLVWVSVALTS